MSKSPISLSIFSLSLIILYSVEGSAIYMALGILFGVLAVLIELKNILEPEK